MIIHPVHVRQPATNDERIRAQAIVDQYGSISLAPFALFDDKSYFFSPNGSVIAYVLKGWTALVLGDPIGPANDVQASILAFMDFCRHNGWQVGFYQVQPYYLEIYKQIGFKILRIGQEAIVDLTAFPPEGKISRKLRYEVNRLTRHGYRVEIFEPPLNDSLLDELKEVNNEWRTGKKGNEFHFSVGWFNEKYIRDSIVAVVYNPEGCISAFTNIVTKYQRNEAALDLMRRRRTNEHGTMDFLFISVFYWAIKQGYEAVSLGFSPLSGTGEKADDPFMEKVLRFFHENVRKFHNLNGLHEFKDKFHPRWESRYLIYPGLVSLPAVALAIARAHDGNNFMWTYLKR